MTHPTLTLLGATEHTLKDISLELPHNAWIAVVGPSGSGKSTLAMDTLFAEGQRRYLSSLSDKARQALGKMGRPTFEHMHGVRPALAISQRQSPGNVRSTVGTRSGIHDLLRLLFAREGTHATGAPLTRSLFSFNHPLGACDTCNGLGLADEVDPELLIKDATKSIRDGALVPTLRSGYTVYSQVTVEVMDEICRVHGFDVDTPWQALSVEQRRVVLYGTTAIKVSFGKHALEARLKWQGITARPRAEGYYRGLVPVIEETLRRDRNPNILRFVRSIRCKACDGSRLGPIGRTALVHGQTLPQLLDLPLARLYLAIADLPESPVVAALRPELSRRVQSLTDVGLGHLALSRPSPTLSGGEAQRLRLAALTSTQLGGQLIVIDEPTLGLHPSEQPGLIRTFRDLQRLGNTLVVVEHDPILVAQADYLVQLGPGGGPHGGRLLYAGPPPPHPLGQRRPLRDRDRTKRARFELRDAKLHNLTGVDFTVRAPGLTVVAGPSGAGKTSLIMGCLVPALDRDPNHQVLALNAKPIGRTSRSTPATYTGIMDRLRKRFAATEAAKSRKWKAGRFSYNNKDGRCGHCEGLGYRRLALHLVADAELVCERCGGGRFSDETLQVRWRGWTIAQILGWDVETARDHLRDEADLHPMLAALDDLGLGYLRLGQSSSTLSGGEAQRVKLATVLGAPTTTRATIVLDEPDRGLHPSDLARLIRCLDALVERGHGVVAISHHPELWAAADRLVELGEGGIVAQGTPTQVSGASTPTGLILAGAGIQTPLTPRLSAGKPLVLGGVRTHNLAGVDLSIDRGQLVGVVGVSGSGKSSLVFDTLAALAWARVGESLPFQVRRFVRQLPAPDLDSCRGLTPVVALRAGASRPGRRSTVATMSGIGPTLRLLWSRATSQTEHGLSAAHFSPDRPEGACASCDGLGQIERCDPAKLITHPERALSDGAMAGTRPGRFFGEADGQYMATLAIAADHAGVHIAGPYSGLDEPARALILYGTGDAEYIVTWRYKRGKREGEHTLTTGWPGLCALVEQEAQKRAGSKRAAEYSAPLSAVLCPTCAGAGLAAPARDIIVAGLTLSELLDRPVVDAQSWLASAVSEPAIDALRPGLRDALNDLDALGLAHLSLGRRSQTLSDGELQRVRLATHLKEGLSGITYVLDEPGRGLADEDLAGLTTRLQRLRDADNTVIVVTHREVLMRACDALIQMGPGAGAQGGQITAQGPPSSLLPPVKAPATGRISRPAPILDGPKIVGANANNLRDVNLTLPASGLVVVGGVSGSGKTSLVFDVIGPSASAGAPVNCRAAVGLERYSDVVRVGSMAPGGRRTLAEHVGLLGPLQKWFSGLSGLPQKAFSYRSPAGACPVCKGAGVDKVSLDVLADLRLPCQGCDGARYRPSTLQVRWQGQTIAEVLATGPAALLPGTSDLPPSVGQALTALVELGLGEVAIHRVLSELSSGQRQRAELAAGLAKSRTGRALFLLDEPDAGLHDLDLDRLIVALRRLTSAGDLVVAISHRRRLIDAADYSISLGPGSGSAGGTII